MTYTNENIGVAGFTMIPNELIENMELNGSLLLTMIALYRFKNNQNNSCFPSYQTLSKYARCSRRYVILNMKKLEEMELVKVSRHDKEGKNSHASNVYTLQNPSPKDAKPKANQDDAESERIIENKHKKVEENPNQPPSEPTSPPSELTSPPSELASPPSELTSPPSELTSPPSELTSPPSELSSPELYLSNNTKSKKTNLNKKHIYGMNHNVIFTQEEYEQLKQEFPQDYQEHIEKLSNYMKSSGRSYKNHLSTIRLWENKSRQEAKKAESFHAQSYSKSFAHKGTAIPDYSQCKGVTL